MPKAQKPPRHEGLASQYLQEPGAEAAARQTRKSLARPSTKSKHAEREEKDEEFVDAKMSRKILDLARQQQEEIEHEDGMKASRRDIANLVNNNGSSGTAAVSLTKARDTLNDPRIMPDDDSGDDDDNNDDRNNNDYDDSDEGEFGGFGSGDEEVEELIVDEEDEAIFEKLMPQSAMPRQTLAEMILERIEQQQKTLDNDSSHILAPTQPAPPQLPPKVVEVYTKVGVLLSRYRSGKLPKAFKIIPSLRNWQDILYLTRPDMWSAGACYEATRLLVSNLTAAQCQRFMRDILLPRVRDDIAANKKLNYHLYMSLKKALYKPAAFFKGFLFPLVQSGSCTLKESAIVASVLTKVSVPALHSAAALLRLAEMEFSGPAALFIRVLLDKKYALPFKVVDGLVLHFLRWRAHDRPFAVLEHQSLLVFAQRYKQDMTVEQKQALLDVVRLKGHDKIGPEVKRELTQSISRGDPLPPEIDTEMQL
ncbi:snoRNA-binding rRNA-processing protein [Savitreella phatthalungensis]